MQQISDAHFLSDCTVISPPKHSDASWAESKDFTSASLNRYLRRSPPPPGEGPGAAPCMLGNDNSPLVVFVSVRVDDVPDEAVVMAAVRRARVHRDADEVVLVALGDLGLALVPESCSRRTTTLRNRRGAAAEG